jgi:hypothetical protein
MWPTTPSKKSRTELVAQLRPPARTRGEIVNLPYISKDHLDVFWRVTDLINTFFWMLDPKKENLYLDLT